MPETDVPPPSLEGLSLAEIAEAAARRRLPPVDRWNPARCGDSHMRIAADGTWFHQGDPIARPAMVRLFAGLLRREADGGYALVTPVERLAIAVDDLPFVAVELASEGAGPARRLAFRLNTDEVVVAGRDHPLRLEDGRPMLEVRAGLAARIARGPFYELAEIALDERASPAGLWSGGAFFPLEEA